MGVNIWINRGKIYLDIYIKGGDRSRVSTGLSVCEDKAQNKEVMRQAKILRSKKEQQVVSSINGLIDPIIEKQSLYQYAKNEASEYENKKHPLKKVLHYLEKYNANIPIGMVSSAWIENFQGMLLKDPQLGPKTCENYMCALRTMFKKAVRDNILPKDPCIGVKHVTVPENIKDYLTADEIDRLILTPVGGKLGGEVRKAFLFGLCTGLRISDLKALKWGDINIDHMQIELKQGKTKKAVYIPLKDEAWKSIQDGMKTHNDKLRVFPLLATTKTNTNQYLDTWKQKAGITKPVGWHITRHTFATTLLANGVDLYTVQKLLGHTKIGTTQIYAKAIDKKRREAIDALPDFGILREAKS